MRLEQLEVEPVSREEMLQVLKSGQPDGDQEPGETHGDSSVEDSELQGMQGASCFAVQLQESPQPIDAASIPSLSIFRKFTLYATDTIRDGQSWHCLRLGFFIEAIAAEHVARYLRRRFAAASVVSVGEPEWTQANAISPHPST